MADDLYDLVVIGGGVNGCGIARDAAGRGLRVLLAEKGDLASATSSASTKMFHGGLRYLEYYEFRLVREALKERETLLCAMPHISWPLRFVLPLGADGRPGWLIRLGLFVYDHLGGRRILPGTRRLDLTRHPAGAALKPGFRRAFEYSDCWVDDSRLVALTARDAAKRGAEVLTRCACLGARREGGLWRVTLEGREVRARALVNAAGPWVAEVLRERLGATSDEGVRLVRGSHIVTRRLFDHDQPYFLQQLDGRVVFALPYEDDFTLIGTTDEDHDGGAPVCTEAERDYLLAAVNRYLKAPVTAEDVVWRFSGVRPLYDDGASSATEATRDYVLSLSAPTGEAPLLSVFGGKITTSRRLAEEALDRLAPHLPMGRAWTAGAPLPGGDFPVDGVAALVGDLRARHPFLDERWARRLVRAYGTDAAEILGKAASASDLGEDFGATLTAREVDWLMAREYARTAEDVLWRRSKLGLRLDAAQTATLARYMDGTARRAA